jgi:hypothetical protein
VKRGEFNALFVAVTAGVVLGWCWRLAAEHHIAVWWVRIPVVYALGYLIIRLSAWILATRRKAES